MAGKTAKVKFGIDKTKGFGLKHVTWKSWNMSKSTIKIEVEISPVKMRIFQMICRTQNGGVSKVEM
jgi:hypothetical protein